MMSAAVRADSLYLAAAIGQAIMLGASAPSILSVTPRTIKVESAYAVPSPLGGGLYACSPSEGEVSF